MRTIELLDEEAQLLEKLFEDLEHFYICEGCNEFKVPSTPEMNLMVAIVETCWYDSKGVPKKDRPDMAPLVGNDILTDDHMVLEYFQNKFGIKKEKAV